MDWVNLLKFQQVDFIRRLQDGQLLYCDRENMHSELAIISGEKLTELTDICWQLADQYKANFPIGQVFNDILRIKLPERIVKNYLEDLIADIPPDSDPSQPAKFILKHSPNIKIAIKSCYGRDENLSWEVSQEELENNDCLIFLRHEKEFDHYDEYIFILAGFLPTQLVKLNAQGITLSIRELLYLGGLRFYLEEIANKKEKGDIKEGKYEIKNKGNYQQAIAKYTSAINVNPTDAKPYLKRAIVLFKTGKVEEALEDLNQAISIKEDYGLAYHWRAYIKRNLGKYAEAIEDYSKEISINPAYVYSFYYRGLTYSKISKYKEAIEDFSQAILLNPELFQGYYNRGYARYSLGDNRGAIADYNRAIEINPNLFQAYYSRGISRAKMGDTDKAIADYTKAISINPHYAKAYYNRGVVFYKEGNYQAALEDYDQALKIDRSLFPAYYNRGIVLSELKEQEGIIAAYYDSQVSPPIADAYKKLDLARIQIDRQPIRPDSESPHV